ncbi:MAG: hypothetical protein ACOCZK_04755 [Planctomycetota bacterium]
MAFCSESSLSCLGLSCLGLCLGLSAIHFTPGGLADESGERADGGAEEVAASAYDAEPGVDVDQGSLEDRGEVGWDVAALAAGDDPASLGFK